MELQELLEDSEDEEPRGASRSQRLEAPLRHPADLVEHQLERYVHVGAAAAGARLAGIRIVLEDLSDPGNRAAILRSVEALGLLHVHEVACVSQAGPLSCELSADVFFSWEDGAGATLQARCFRALVPPVPLVGGDGNLCRWHGAQSHRRAPELSLTYLEVHG
ncbi:hypothetical protein AK812_SmicGene9163 [Symbiodinium microadriaticum]|uniref:tRNA/rRNA methyltransferase SpoU type domain-containing protein n=1 Tax=Symbiodinium microadriaticum TaxID=2951 RepID=A0A1Q9EIY0_SYMMI|nr:hypothetical protein AK812_SmicGene9163 [Symbiodinium microadriaticum]